MDVLGLHLGEADESVSLFSTLVICNGVTKRVLFSWLGVLSVIGTTSPWWNLILLDGKWAKVIDHSTMG